ncbi:MAG: FecR family protein [Candidatus Korobacteraceae bacterium]
MTRHIVSALSAVAAFVLVAGSLGALADSHVRIVRLSSVEGQVQMDRATGAGLERAILNTPVVEGTRLVTGSDGLAEIEFENQSALRLTGDSEVKFSQLLMNDAGAKVNQIQVVKGLVYLDAASRGDDTYRLIVGNSSFLVRRDTGMRLSATPNQIQVAVFKGEVQLESQPQPVTVGRKETLTLAGNSGASYTVAKGVEPARFDAWNKEREAYSSTYAENQGYGGPSRAYGLQDLNYYGNFFYAGGYGYVWQPFGFANAMMGWDPYSNGAWMFYPGMGYAWASAYPWGWLPYHYGSWAFINGAGWAWLPGGNYGGQWYASNFLSVPRVTRAPASWTAATPPAATAATNFARPTVLVGKAGAPLTIPGGRIPPNFASLVPGRTVGSTATAQSFAKSNAGNAMAHRNVFTATDGGLSAAPHGSPAHVFAPPAARSVAVGAPEPGISYGGASSGAGVLGHASTTSGTTAPAAHASSGAAQK